MKRKRMPCTRCRKGEIRQHVNVFVETSAANRNLSKSGIRSDDVKIWGAGWDTATLFCTKCGYAERLAPHAGPGREEALRLLGVARRALRGIVEFGGTTGELIKAARSALTSIGEEP